MVSYLAKKLVGKEEPENGGNMATRQAREKKLQGFTGWCYALIRNMPWKEHGVVAGKCVGVKSYIIDWIT